VPQVGTGPVPTIPIHRVEVKKTPRRNSQRRLLPNQHLPIQENRAGSEGSLTTHNYQNSYIFAFTVRALQLEAHHLLVNQNHSRVHKLVALAPNQPCRFNPGSTSVRDGRANGLQREWQRGVISIVPLGRAGAIDTP